MSLTPILGITELAPSQSQPEIPVNAATRVLEAIGVTSVISNVLHAPPGSPSDGDIYIPAATATGAWAGKEDTLQVYTGTAWVTVNPKNGLIARNVHSHDWIWYSEETSPSEWTSFP